MAYCLCCPASPGPVFPLHAYRIDTALSLFVYILQTCLCRRRADVSRRELLRAPALWVWPAGRLTSSMYFACFRFFAFVFAAFAAALGFSAVTEPNAEQNSAA